MSDGLRLQQASSCMRAHATPPRPPAAAATTGGAGEMMEHLTCTTSRNRYSTSGASALAASSDRFSTSTLCAIACMAAGWMKLMLDACGMEGIYYIY